MGLENKDPNASLLRVRNGNEIFFNFPRKILPSGPEYVVGGMETTATEKERKGERFDFRLDPNRIRTDAEIQLFADVFEISVEEARRIIMRDFRIFKRQPGKHGVMPATTAKAFYALAGSSES